MNVAAKLTSEILLQTAGLIGFRGVIEFTRFLRWQRVTLYQALRKLHGGHPILRTLRAAPFPHHP